MTKALLILFLLAFGYFFGQNTDTQDKKTFARTRVVKGKIIIRDNFKSDTNMTKLTITLNWQRHQLFITKPDNRLEFSFDSLNNSLGTLRVRSDNNNKDTTLILSTINGDTLNLVIPFPPICKFDYSIDNKVCPICKKTDKVIPFVYGYVEKQALKRDLKDYKLGGCIVSGCQPHYYCKRDKLDF